MLLALVPLSLGLPTANVYHWKNLSPTIFSHYQSLPQLVQPYFYAARPSLPQQTSSLLRSETDKSFRLVTELAELGAKHVVTAVAQLPNINPKKKAQFESIGLVGVTPEETERLNSLLKELGDLGADASITLAQNAGNLARAGGLGGKKAVQIAKFAKLVPLLKNLVDLGSDTTKGSEAGASKSGLELLESIGLDLDSGLKFLKENDLDVGDGLQLLSRLSSNDDGDAYFNGLSDLTQLLGIGSLSLGASGGASAIKSLETPELRAQLDKTNELLTELAELGASYVVSAVADLPGLSPEKSRRYKSIGAVGAVEKARLNSLLKELGELGAEASIGVTKAGGEVPGLAKLAKLVPILSGLAELSSVYDSEDAEANLAATKAVFSSSSLNNAANPFGQSYSGFVHPSASSKVITPELRAQSDKTIRLVTELAEIGTKYVVSAVADLPDVDPKKKALFQEIGLTGITAQEKARLNSLLLELGELGSDASIAVAAAASNVARTPGLTQKKAAQIAKFAKLVPILKGLTDLASDTASDSGNSNPSNSAGDGLELLDTIGLDLETGLSFLRENNLDISDGLKLLDTVVGDTGSFSLKSLESVSQLLGVGSLSLGATGGASAIKTLETPELKAKLDKTNKLLTELAELGAVYVVSAVAELPTISSEKRLRYKKVGPVGEKEKRRLNSLLKELGELGSEASIAVTEAGAKVPGLARLAKLVPILTTLAELSLVSDSGDAQENQAATRNVFSSLPLTAAASQAKSYGGSNGLCNGRPCIVNPSSGYPVVLQANPSPYRLMRFVHL